MTSFDHAREKIDRVRDILMRSAGKRTFSPILFERIKPGVAVHGDRSVGKTQALLCALYEREAGNAIVVCPTRVEAEFAAGAYKEAYGTGPRQFWPLFLSCNFGTQLDFVKGDARSFYCDEWFMFPMSAKKDLIASGRVAGAVGTMPGLSGCIDSFPLEKTL